MTDLPISEFGRSIQLIGAVFASDKESHVVLLPSYDLGELPTSTSHYRMTVEDWQALQHQTDSVPTEALVKEGDKPAGKAIIMKSHRQVSKIVSWKVFKRDDYTCRYCARDDVPLTVDHLVTWESGGPSTEANLVASCGPCNNCRGEMPFGEWLKCKDYKRRSVNLSTAQQFANQALLPTLTNIPVSPHVVKGKKRKGRR